MPDPERLTEAEIMARFQEKTGRVPEKTPEPEKPGRLQQMRLPRECPACGKRFFVDGLGLADTTPPLRLERCTDCRPVLPVPKPKPELERPQRVSEDDE
jgi:hypothetical protein